ncbi:MAG: sensor histidine kinase [Candidatus Kapaibacterium sp.]
MQLKVSESGEVYRNNSTDFESIRDILPGPAFLFDIIHKQIIDNNHEFSRLIDRNRDFADLIINELSQRFSTKAQKKSLKDKTVFAIDLIHGKSYYRCTCKNFCNNKDSSTILCSLTDISDLNKAAILRENLIKRLKKTENELKQTIKDRDKFFGIIAHDIRGPLGGIMKLSDTLANDFDNITLAEFQEMAEGFKSSSYYLYRLTENLLYWTRIKRGKIEYKPEKLDMKELIEEIVNINLGQADLKDIILHDEILSGTYVYADKNMISAVIRNLINNALKFTNPGGNIYLRSFANKNNTISISVSDDGIGMDEETSKKLFQLDYKTRQIGTAGERGSGLGLLLCREFMEIHRGKIEFISKQNKGTTFTISLKSASSK